LPRSNFPMETHVLLKSSGKKKKIRETMNLLAASV
jgi:hypothetical protein